MHVLHPRMLDDLDAEALVVWVCPREVAVGQQAARVMATDELEFLPVAHGDVSVLLLQRRCQSCVRAGPWMEPCLVLCYFVRVRVDEATI